MKKAIIYFAFIMFFSSASAVFAEGEPSRETRTVALSGKVLDKASHEALTGALVEIEGTDLRAYTDFEGNFKIEGIVPDTYTLKCSLISYQDKEEEIAIEQSISKCKLALEIVPIVPSTR